MDDYTAVADDPRRGRPFLRALLILLFGVLIGAVATGYALTHWDAADRFVRSGSVAVPPPAAPAAIFRQPAAVPARPQAEDQALLSRRIGQIETRIAAIDARTQAAVGNADRAEGLLVAFAARRALDRGVALGYIETLLRDRFGGGQPQAVATILNAAHQPVTLDQLQSGLESAAPGLMARSTQENWWDNVRRELAGMIVVRRAGEPSAAPQDRLSRAREQLRDGNVEGALAEVSRMPGRAGAAAWITLARRYVSARSALDIIETAALLTPSRPSGAPTVWPAPAPEPDPAADAQPAPSDILLSR
ncbi:MAG: hypothetical protein JWL91_1635 [Sphingomonas bacterium]|nr:hypothetical protein [Sphingomonas bacterium]MDB5689759.1 hypothetical protein [Sphingomonas bacterium]